jgi:hypothetical protein
MSQKPIFFNPAEQHVPEPLAGITQVRFLLVWRRILSMLSHDAILTIHEAKPGGRHNPENGVMKPHPAAHLTRPNSVSWAENADLYSTGNLDRGLVQ